MDLTEFEVKVGSQFPVDPSPAPGAPFTLVVNAILRSSLLNTHQNASNSANKMSLCKVHRSDQPSLNSILKIMRIQAEYKAEADLCIQIHQAWLKFQTPYVVKFYGFLNLPKDPSKPNQDLIGGIHMKYYPLGNLFDGLYKKNWICQLREDALKPIFKSTLAGLHFLHTKANIAHRDIKLENIFLLQEANGFVGVLGDFGYSSPKEGKPIPGGGTQPMMTVIQGRGLTYTAPEARKNSAYDFKCDIWSLGVLFYIMLFGVDPTGRFTIKKDMYADHANVNWTTNFQGTPGFGSSDVELQFPQKAEVSPALRDILKRMTEYNPTSRATALQVLQEPYFSDPLLAWIKY